MASRTIPPHQDISAPLMAMTPLMISAFAELALSRVSKTVRDKHFIFIGGVSQEQIDHLARRSRRTRGTSAVNGGLCENQARTGTRARWYFSNSRLALTMAANLATTAARCLPGRA